MLNNLAEADFNLAAVSIVTRDLKTRDALAKDSGPLQGAHPGNLRERLLQVGLSPSEAQRCSEAVAQGKVLVAMTCPQEAQAAAVEMLKDHAAHIIKE